MNINIHEHCFLCTAFSNIQDFPCEIPPPKSFSKGPEYFLYRTSHSYAIVGLGAITPGYILLVPNKHYDTVSQISGMEWEDFLLLKSIIHYHLKNYYGGAVFFEHGALSTCRLPSGACVDHAHLHSIPALARDFEDEIPKEFRRAKIASLEELKELSLHTDRYLLLENKKGETFVFQTTCPVPPQFFRRIWAKLSGKPEEFDFALFPEYQNMLATYNNFRNDYHTSRLTYLRFSEHYEKPK